MRFLGDMGVSWRVIEWLRASDHDAVHLRDQGLQRLPNGDIFQKGVAEQRIVLTFDLDFGEILAGSAGQVVSVVTFRLPPSREESTRVAVPHRRAWALITQSHRGTGERTNASRRHRAPVLVH
jgi:predicted nuclease of predicted toxin-antitoxin system